MSHILKLTTDHLTLFQDFVSWNAEADVLPPPQTELNAWLVNPNHHVWLALDQETIVGGLTAYTLPCYQQSGQELFIYEVGVDDGYQRQGIGKALVNACIAYAKAASYLSVYVATEPGNLRARKLYAAAGGTEEVVSWWVWE